jgi:hypothetical protein
MRPTELDDTYHFKRDGVSDGDSFDCLVLQGCRLGEPNQTVLAVITNPPVCMLITWDSRNGRRLEKAVGLCKDCGSTALSRRVYSYMEKGQHASST